MATTKQAAPAIQARTVNMSTKVAMDVWLDLRTIAAIKGITLAEAMADALNQYRERSK